MIKVPPVKASARFISKKQISEFVYEFVFEMVTPELLDFLPGQYIAINIDTKTKRQYSISTSPLESKKRFEITLDIRPRGVGVQYLMNLTKDDTIEFIGQIGLFTLPEQLATDLYFFSTGTGLAPIKSMIESLILSGVANDKNIHLYFGCRTISSIIYQDIFDRYKNDKKIEEYRITISREKNDKYDIGHVTQYIDQLSKDAFEKGEFYLCGSGSMIESVIELLNAKSVGKEQIFLEKFY